MRFSYLFFIVISLTACSKQKSYEVEIIGHAGSGLSNHQSFGHNNSLKSIEIALFTEGCDGVEVDVQLSKDHTLWLFHDEKLEQNTNENGFVFEKTDVELSEIQYKNQGGKLIRLKDVPKDWWKGKTIFLDIKNYFNGSELDFTNTMNDALSSFFSQSFSAQFILLSNRLHFLSEWDFNGVQKMAELSSSQMGNLSGVNLSEIDGVVMKYQSSSKENIEKIRKLGKKTVVYDLRAVKSIRKALENGVDFLISDDVITAVIERN